MRGQARHSEVYKFLDYLRLGLRILEMIPVLSLSEADGESFRCFFLQRDGLSFNRAATGEREQVMLLIFKVEILCQDTLLAVRVLIDFLIEIEAVSL